MTLKILAVSIVLILLSDSYLRYLSFRNEMTPIELKNLRRRLVLCGLVCGVIYAAAFDHFGVNAVLYKLFLMTGWIPQFVVLILTVRRNLSQHIFVCGMVAIWSLMQHNWAAIIVVLLEVQASDFLAAHAMTYLLLFALCLPVERRCFVKLLPPQKFFDDYGKFAALLPFIMGFGVLILWAQEPMIHSWQERFSRFYLPFVFFFFYRHMLLTTDSLQEQKLSAQNLRRMKDQLATLSEYNRLMNESREAVAVMRHDLRHSYRLIFTMLQDGKVESVKDYIAAQEKSLAATAVKNFCRPPLLNAALSVYLSRAESLGVKIRHKINLPQTLDAENDLALLVSNLLENALKASLRQLPHRRQISVVMQRVAGQFILEIANLCDSPVAFDEKNRPRTSRQGHGLGMASIKIFADKYDAYTDFSQENGIFKVTMYWLS